MLLKKTGGNTVYNLLLTFCLLMKVLADFLSLIYLLTLVLKHATNHIEQRYKQLKSNHKNEKTKFINWNHN